MEQEENIETKSDIDYKDLYLRLYADFDNFKKRIIKEKEEIRNNTKIKTIDSVLDVHNDLSLSLKYLKNSEDVELILRKIEGSLLKEGISVIQTYTYDENLHEAISIINDVREDSSIIENIHAVISNGYILDEKPIRYAKIILIKGK